jgi:hypothetical protein
MSPLEIIARKSRRLIDMINIMNMRWLLAIAPRLKADKLNLVGSGDRQLPLQFH